MTASAPSGRQVELRYGAQRAVVVEVGGGLRDYTVDGQHVLDGYLADRMADGGRGQPLLPWPNRLADGQYEWEGRRLQLPINELARRNASHGLTQWLNWQVASQDPAKVQMALTLHPRPGYPFMLALGIAYSLSEAGLEVRTTAQNLGEEAAPFGVGFHPYITAGTEVIDACQLRIPAASVLEADDRMIPTGKRHAVDKAELDYRELRPIGSQAIDHCFTELIRDADGLARAQLAAPADGPSVTMWLDAHYRYLQVFTGDTLATERRRQGIAIEPMTCPPNAFASGMDVIRLAPGACFEAAWGLVLTGR